MGEVGWPLPTGLWPLPLGMTPLNPADEQLNNNPRSILAENPKKQDRQGVLSHRKHKEWDW